MTVWVALLRGVNVGGITVRSDDLARVFTDELGFGGVSTILASGNVVFVDDADADGRATIKRAIETALRARFSYDAWIVLVTLGELTSAIAGYPFDAADGTRQPYVVFGSDDARLDELADAAAALDAVEDPVLRGEGVLYWSPATGTSVSTPFAKVLARRRFAESTTNRNLRTLEKIRAKGAALAPPTSDEGPTPQARAARRIE